MSIEHYSIVNARRERMIKDIKEAIATLHDVMPNDDEFLVECFNEVEKYLTKYIHSLIDSARYD